MKETGIIMTGDHPILIQQNLKTVTRRTQGLEFVNQDPDAYRFLRMEGDLAIFEQVGFCMTQIEPRIPRQSFPKKSYEDSEYILFYIKCPYGQIGDILYVKEVHSLDSRGNLHYKADEPEWINLLHRRGARGQWQSSRFMFKKYARIWLEITGLRAERLQEISDSDCQSEGCQYPQWQGSHTSWKGAYKALWDSLNAKRGYPWESNSWVWVISFREVEHER